MELDHMLTLVTFAEVRNGLALFDHCANEFVATDEVRGAFEVTAVEVKVGALQDEAISYVAEWFVRKVLTQSAVEETLRTASVGFWSFGYGLSSTAT